MKNYIYCGHIQYKKNLVHIYFNTKTNKKDFYIDFNNLIMIKEPYLSELNSIFNKFSVIENFTKSKKVRIISFSLSMALLFTGDASVANFNKEMKVVESSSFSLLNVDKAEMSKYLYDNGIFNYINFKDNYILTYEDFLKIFLNIVENQVQIYNASNSYNNEWSILYSKDANMTVEKLIYYLYDYLNAAGYMYINYPIFDNGYDEINSKYRNAMSWAIVNNIITDINIDPTQTINKSDLISILYRFIMKYDILNNHDNYKEEAKKFLDALNSNDNLSAQIKKIFRQYAEVINQYNFSEKTLKRINNIFKNLNFKYEERNDDSLVIAFYDSKDNTITSYYDSNNPYFNNYILHEGFHAFFNNYGLLKKGSGFRVFLNFGRGINEGMTQLMTEEYSTEQNLSTYIYTTTLSKYLSIILTPEKTLCLLADSDVYGLIKSIIDIYNDKYSNLESYEKAISLINKMDVINEMEKGNIDIQNDYISDTYAMIDDLMQIKYGISISEEPTLNCLSDRMFNLDQYYYYYISDYRVNQDFANLKTTEAVKISKDINLEELNIYGLSYKAASDYLISSGFSEVDIKLKENFENTK